MTQVAEVMTRGVRALAPSDNLQRAAQAMDELNVGAIPVCDDERVIGVVTDRDITIRGVAQGCAPESTPLTAVMSEGVSTCYEDDDLDEVTVKMQDQQIRRVPVLDRNEHLIGMLSLGDLAAKGDEQHAGETLSDISIPAEPDRSHQSAASGSAGGGSASGKARRATGGQR